MKAEKITGNEAVRRIQTVDIVSELEGDKFSYAVFRNTQKLERIVREMIKQRNPLPETKSFREAFEKERIEILNEFAKKDSNGKIVSDRNGSAVFEPGKEEMFSEAINILKEKHPEAIKSFEDAENKYRESLQNEYEIETYDITKSELPANISPKQLNAISWMFNETPTGGSLKLMP